MKDNLEDRKNSFIVRKGIIFNHYSKRTEKNET